MGKVLKFRPKQVDAPNADVELARLAAHTIKESLSTREIEKLGMELDAMGGPDEPDEVTP